MKISTNYYRVFGTNMAQLRAALAQARPWKDHMDARTDWTVRWKYSLADFGNVCRVRTFEVETTITVTLPAWQPPPGVSPSVVAGWQRFISNLKRHEDGHVALALQAGAQVRKQAGAIKEARSAKELTDRINQAADKVLAAFREREKEYDRRTNHGLTQDAPAR